VIFKIILGILIFELLVLSQIALLCLIKMVLQELKGSDKE